MSSRTIAGSIPNRSSTARSCARAPGVVPVDALAEDQLVLRRVLPADQLGDRDLVAVGLEHEAADHVGQVRAELAAMQGCANSAAIAGSSGLDVSSWRATSAWQHGTTAT